jgi:hypothetical protein
MILDTKLFDTGMFNGGTSLVTSYSSDYAVFENFSLSDNTHMVLTGLGYSGPSTDIQGGSIPRDNGMYLTARYFRENVIELRGYVKASTGALMDAYLDTIRKSVRKRQGNLDITDLNGTAKRFIATVDNFDSMFAERRGYHVTICPFTIRFRCKTPFGTARSYTSTSQSITSSPTNISAYQAGTIAANPVITLNFDAASSVTVVDVQRLDSNGTILEEIQYSGSIAAGNILVFDSEQKIVTKNGTQVNYTGSFLTADAAVNLYKITITATSFIAYTTVSYKSTYL